MLLVIIEVIDAMKSKQRSRYLYLIVIEQTELTSPTLKSVAILVEDVLHSGFIGQIYADLKLE